MHTKTHDEGRKERASERASECKQHAPSLQARILQMEAEHTQSIIFFPNQSHAYNTIYLSVHTTLRTRSAIILQYTIAYDASPFSFVQRIRQISMQSQVRRVRACDALGCVFFPFLLSLSHTPHRCFFLLLWHIFVHEMYLNWDFV